VTFRERAREYVRLLLAVLVLAFVVAHGVVERCGRAGCYRTPLGSWLVAQGGALADLVHGLEFAASAFAAVALAGYGVSRLRARLA
jgi:hypothetical protein